MVQIGKLLDVNKFKDYNEMIDSLEETIVRNLPSVELPLAHTFTHGMYSREMVAPAGSIITSQLHLTKHQFIVSKGSMLIFHENEGWIKITAPYHGVTKAGSRRIGVFLEESIWTTFHSSDLIEDREYSIEEMEEIVSLIEGNIIKKSIHSKKEELWLGQQ